jgi:hypothetical protein
LPALYASSSRVAVSTGDSPSSLATPEKAIKACRSSLSACETLGDFGPGGLVSASKEWDAEEVKEGAGRSDWLFEFRWLALRPDEVRLVGGFGAVQ